MAPGSRASCSSATRNCAGRVGGPRRPITASPGRRADGRHAVPTARSPQALAWPDLVWSHFSRPRFGAFDERLAAAAAAGFAWIGPHLPEYARLREEEGRLLADIVAAFDRHDLCLAELEALEGWWAVSGPDVEDSARMQALAFEMAEVLGARYLQIIGPYDCSFDQAVTQFAALCDRAAEFDVKVGIEWLPYTNITSAVEAQQIVEAAGRPNGGYCADIWHHTRRQRPVAHRRGRQRDLSGADERRSAAADQHRELQGRLPHLPGAAG